MRDDMMFVSINYEVSTGTVINIQPIAKKYRVCTFYCCVIASIVCMSIPMLVATMPIDLFWVGGSFSKKLLPLAEFIDIVVVCWPPCLMPWSFCLCCLKCEKQTFAFLALRLDLLAFLDDVHSCIPR